ncbi:MAG TPA: squalene synthase HpnC [Nocardioidaceae bacterium]|jgi:squalene synthase HpnC
MSRENFPVALRVLPADVRADLWALYRFARHVDDVGDESAGDRVVALKALQVDVQRLYDGETPESAEVAGLATLVRRREVPPQPWLALVEANLQDQYRTRYETFEDLLGYCELSANPVGRVVLHVFGQATPDRVALSDRVCTALQLVEHWQDLREDYLRGRVYLPAEDMRRFRVAESDLGAEHASPELAALVAYETDRALAWLNSGAVLVSTLRGWARFAVAGYVNGGRVAARGLRRHGHDPLPGLPKPTTRQVVASVLRESVRSPG